MRVRTYTQLAMFSTLRIEVETHSGAHTGTGFLFRYQKHGLDYVFLVTNKHVLEGATSIEFFFLAEAEDQPVLGKRTQIELDRENIDKLLHEHPDPDIDVAVIWMNPVFDVTHQDGRSFYLVTLPSFYTPTEEDIEELDVLENVFFVGYPNGIFDEINGTPIIRRGITATPLQLDYNGTPTFLIDASVVPGSSGSPVFGARRLPNGKVRLLLLGIIAAVLCRNEIGDFRLVPAPTSLVPYVEFQQMIDLGVVFKWNTITATVEGALERFLEPQDPSTGESLTLEEAVQRASALRDAQSEQSEM